MSCRIHIQRYNVVIIKWKYHGIILDKTTFAFLQVIDTLKNINSGDFF